MYLLLLCSQAIFVSFSLPVSGKETKMNNQKKENQVYVASLNKYVDSGALTPKQYDELVNSYRTKQKKRRECFLPKEEYHLCEGDCASCKYHIPLISFDDTYISDKDGNVLTIGDCIAADVSWYR